MVTLFWLLSILLFNEQLTGFYGRYGKPCSFNAYIDSIVCTSEAEEKYVTEFMKSFSKPKIGFQGIGLNITDSLFTGIELKKFDCYQCNFQSQTGDIFKASYSSLSSFKITAENMHPWIKSLKNLKNITSISLTTADSDRPNISRFDFPSTLKKLKLKQFKLYKLDKSTINPLPNLEYLQLYDDEIESIEADTFKNFHNLKELDLSSNKLTSTAGISGLSQLEKLDLSFNDIANLSQNSFTNLKKLKDLNIFHNKFKIVASQTFAELKSLTKLRISNRFLETIEPGALDGLDNLESFDLTSTGQFKIIKAGLFNNLKKITSLKLIYMELETLERGCFDGLNVSEIMITNNKITKLSNDSFSNLPQLKSLSLSDNEISNIETNAFGNLPKLTYLNLASNNMNKINRNVFHTLSALNKLNIYHNDIHEIEQGSFVGTNLTILDLSYNTLTTFTDFSSGLEHLVTLDLSNNEIESIQPNALHNYPNLDILKLSGNKIKIFNDGVFQQLINLKKLELKNCKIENLAENAFNGLKNLEDLDLSDNLINKFPIKIFEATPNLKKLNLGNNQLSNLDGFTNLKNLYSLKLSSNKLKILDSSQIGMPSLKIIDLSSNNIEQIINGELNKNLTKLCLDGNAIESTIDSFYKHIFSISCDDYSIFMD